MRDAIPARVVDVPSNGHMARMGYGRVRTVVSIWHSFGGAVARMLDLYILT